MVAANKHRGRRPPTSPENREQQLISLAMDEAERQLRDGTASAQVLNHFVKLGTTREALEQERLMRENQLLAVKAENLASARRMEELYERALNAMRTYSGQAFEEEEDEYYD